MDKESWKAYCELEIVRGYCPEGMKNYSREVKRAIYGSLGYALFRVNFYASKFITTFKKEIIVNEKKEMVMPYKNRKCDKSILKQCNCHSSNKQYGEVENIILDPKDYFKYDSFTKTVCVDACIVEQIKMLWKNEIWTCGCCCGHGRDNPSVAFNSLKEAEVAKELLKKYDKDRKWDVVYWELIVI